MVRTLILALCATFIISCDKQDNSIITPEAIEIASVQEPQTMGILEQLSKDVKSSKSGRSQNDPYITSCVDDRHANIVIAGPIINPSSFVNGVDRLDLDLFTFEGKRYIVIRSEDDLPYGLPNDYQRMWYINEGGSLGVYTSNGKQASIDGDWDFLFGEVDLHYLYEIDEDYNVIGGDRPLSTVNINCDGYSGWYGVSADGIDWSQGIGGEYNPGREIDSVFIKLNTAGEYVAGGYLYENSFYLENNFTNNISTRCSEYVQLTSELPVGEYVTSYGSYENNGITMYQYCLEEENEYELEGYQLRSNGSTVNFVWYPHGLSNIQHIAEMILTKTDRAPDSSAYREASEAFNSVNFVERHGNWFRKSSDSVYSSNAQLLPEYIYVTETEYKTYEIGADECYTEVISDLSSTHLGASIWHRNVDEAGNRIDRWIFQTRTHGDSNINNPIPSISYYRYDDESTTDINESVNYSSDYVAVDSPQFTICEPADTVN